MKKTLKILSTVSILLALTASSIFASPAFTAQTGAMLQNTASTDEEEGKYDAHLNLSAFFSGQLNFTESLWGRMEFSLQTEDLIEKELFTSTGAQFQIDEISLIKRSPTLNGYNYFSAYMGTYDPIGSDIFLQRYFGIEPIGTKLAESYLGIAGSILYPHFGIGISDVIKLKEKPIAYGAYLYMNNENSQYYIINADARFATSLRYFTMDLCAGIGAPLYDTYKGESIFLVISKVYLHAGTTILIGNNYTTSLFFQGGLFNTSLEKGGKITPAADSIYLLLEPRFRTTNSHINISIYALPQKAVNKCLFLDDTMGVDINIYSETIPIKAKLYTMGIHVNTGFPNYTLLSFKKDNIPNVVEDLKNMNFDINITPYVATDIFNGQINGQIKLKLMDFVNKEWYEAVSAEIGYRTKF